MDRALEVFYDPRQHTDDNSSYSPSAGKPALVVESWKCLSVPLTFMSVEPTTVEQFALAHDRAYVEGVLSGRLHNGFGNRLPAVAATFPWTTGSMVSAAIRVAHAGGVAISPTNGAVLNAVKNADRVVVRVTNTNGTNRVVTFKAGVNPPAPATPPPGTAPWRARSSARPTGPWAASGSWRPRA